MGIINKPIFFCRNAVYALCIMEYNIIDRYGCKNNVIPNKKKSYLHYDTK